MTTLLEDLLFDAPNVKKHSVTINQEFVRKALADIAEDEELARFIL
jgi:ATP-dependent protease HslVU (ClpYQ) ATPase subunit